MFTYLSMLYGSFLRVPITCSHVRPTADILWGADLYLVARRLSFRPTCRYTWRLWCHTECKVYPGTILNENHIASYFGTCVYNWREFGQFRKLPDFHEVTKEMFLLSRIWGYKKNSCRKATKRWTVLYSRKEISNIRRQKNLSGIENCGFNPWVGRYLLPITESKGKPRFL